MFIIIKEAVLDYMCPSTTNVEHIFEIVETNAHVKFRKIMLPSLNFCIIHKCVRQFLTKFNFCAVTCLLFIVLCKRYCAVSNKINPDRVQQ